MTKTVWALLIVMLAASSALADEPEWRPVLKSEESARLRGVVVNHDVGCVFVDLGDRGIYCSGPGATKFAPLKDQSVDGPYGKFVRALRESKDAEHDRVRGKDSRHLFELSRAGVIESTDGGNTWSKPIPLPKALKGSESGAWIEYDPKNDLLYVMKPGGDLYKLSRRK